MVTPEEIEAYQGPVNYMVHAEIYKESNSSPERLMSDSSFKFGNSSLNECLAEGPNTLDVIYNKFIKYRSYQVTLKHDLNKAHNTMQTEDVERHSRRFFMRTSTDDKWDLWAFNVVQIDAWLGATALLTIAVEKVLETWDKVAIEHKNYPKKSKEVSIK